MECTACLDLALEGQRLYKKGHFSACIDFFEAAIRVGTDNLWILSTIYSQLGNAYFVLENYAKAKDYHQADLTIARASEDELAEGRASGNLGNTLKNMGKFDEAIACCKRYLAVTKKFNDKDSKGRALYNLGNVYHVKGKKACENLRFPDKGKASLLKAVEYYDRSLKIMIELEDRSAQGRACGSLGNVHFLLGNLNEAIKYHEERLKIAKEYGDRTAERGAHYDLGNAHFFLREFEVAAEHYEQFFELSNDSRYEAQEAQAYRMLGKIYILLKDYPTAIFYHECHLTFAQKLNDKIGERQAYRSLRNANRAIGNHTQALHYSTQYLKIKQELAEEKTTSELGFTYTRSRKRKKIMKRNMRKKSRQ